MRSEKYFRVSEASAPARVAMLRLCKIDADDAGAGVGADAADRLDDVGDVGPAGHRDAGPASPRPVLATRSTARSHCAAHPPPGGLPPHAAAVLRSANPSGISSLLPKMAGDAPPPWPASPHLPSSASPCRRATPNPVAGQRRDRPRIVTGRRDIGCSDDSFIDFRAGLIAQRRAGTAWCQFHPTARPPSHRDRYRPAALDDPLSYGLVDYAASRDDVPDYPCHGDGQRPISVILAGQKATCVRLRRAVQPCHPNASHLILKYSHLILKSGVRNNALSWSPVTESNRRPSPYHGHLISRRPATA